MDTVELSEMIAVAFLAACGMLMFWQQQSEPVVGRASPPLPPSA